MYRHLLWMLPVSLSLGAVLSFLQPGNWLVGWLAFSSLLLLSFWLFSLLHRWAGGGRALAWMVALAFALRLVTGVGVYLALPVNGYDDVDDRAGFFFTDAHRRDDQAWDLAQSDESILSAFNKTYHTDQYGGLLAFTSLAYRLLSPDAHRPILLILLSAIVAALGMPFFWRAARLSFGEQVALVAGWILVLYPESLLLGGAVMREPYLITLGAMSLWGFVAWQFHPVLASAAPSWPGRDRAGTGERSRRAWLPPSGIIWLGLGLVGMLLVSPVVALFTLVILAGWSWMAREHGRLSWFSFFAAVLVLVVGLVLLAWALNRQGNFGGGPLGVISGWFREAVKWDVYQLERGSGWVQKLFDEMPEWLRLPFVAIYGIFQPVLPAAFIEPTTLTWRITGIARALGWYLLWPVLLYAFIAAWKNKKTRERNLWLWITVISWSWIILTTLRGGGDQWDNPRYRAILLLWQSLAAAYAWSCFRVRSDSWLVRIFLVESIFLAFFTQWYLSRYFHIGGQIPFGWMVALIIGSSFIVLVGGGLWDCSRSRKPGA
ncbi:MAG: hypothetical protein JW963_13620 [Anaerolineales bacterium]|nr:hypothetical protein [Anaerolineales bacterium]